MNRRPGLAVTFVVLAVMAGISLWAAPRMPDSVPIHWNLRGEPDGFGSPLQALTMTPLITIAMALLLWFLPAIDPRREHLVRSGRAYNAMWITLVVFLLGVHTITVLSAATDASLPILSLVPAALGVLFIVIGNYLPKISSNWFMGIRTPWTLTSELSWRRTHRIGGMLFVALGVILLVSSFTIERAAGAIAGAGAVAIAVVTFAYSYVVWRNDPSRGQPRDGAA